MVSSSQSHSEAWVLASLEVLPASEDCPSFFLFSRTSICIKWGCWLPHCFHLDFPSGCTVAVDAHEAILMTGIEPVRWEASPGRSHWGPWNPPGVPFHTNEKNPGRERCAECEYKGHPGPQSGYRRESCTSDLQSRKIWYSASVRLGNCIKGQTFPFFFQAVFSGDLNDVSQAASKSEGTKSVENELL